MIPFFIASGDRFGFLLGDGNITALGTVATGTNVVFDASKSVTLLPGFETQSGAVFRTNLQGCITFEAPPLPASSQK